jgi:prepilin-type N-terminal cleavage/methylation domain-containing protein
MSPVHDDATPADSKLPRGHEDSLHCRLSKWTHGFCLYRSDEAGPDSTLPRVKWITFQPTVGSILRMHTPAFSETSADQKIRILARSRTSSRGFSLAEVMLAMMVLGTSSLAALAAMLFSYRTADSNLRADSALANARAVAEQILTLDQGSLASSALPVDVPSNPSGSLTVNEWNERIDDIHGTPESPDDDLKMSLRPEVVQPDSAGGFLCAQVIIHYRWTENSFFASRTREDAITVVLSDVSGN